MQLLRPQHKIRKRIADFKKKKKEAKDEQIKAQLTVAISQLQWVLKEDD